METTIAFDDTDHIAFLCNHREPGVENLNQPACGKPLHITKIQTNNVVINNHGHTDKCSWIHLKCPVHGNRGWRKAYWTSQDDSYCRHRPISSNVTQK